MNVFISPPENGHETDEGSGDEEDVCLSNLPGKQLRSIKTKSRERLEDCEIPDKRSSNVQKKKMKTLDWQVVDIKERTFTPKASMPSVAGVPRKPHEDLELFLNDELFEILTICI